MSTRKLTLVATLLAAIVLFFALDLGRFLSLDVLRQSQAALGALRDRHPVVTAASFFALYVLATALSLPGAAILTLAAGALFGLAGGTLLVSFASSLGALFAFLLARFLLRDSVRARFGSRLREIDRGVQREGAMYLFTLRLVPFVPFFVINLAMGLTALRPWTFYWVSQAGMLAGTVVYVNAGTQLAQVQSVRSILSPALIGSFALLAVFPWLARGMVRVFQGRRVYARWRGRRPRRFDRNLVVIGAGAAGLVSAYIAAAVKASVTLVEGHKMGGDCLNYGCVPSKALIRSAKLAHQMRHAGAWGLQDVAPSFSLQAVMRRIRAVVSAVEPHDSPERFRSLGVDVVAGHARIVDPWSVEITHADGSCRKLTTRAIVIAAGARPIVPPLPGLDAVGYVTSDTLWDDFGARQQPPKRLLVLGGGPIGCELSQAFARLGVEVTQVELAERLLAREDDEVSEAAARALQADGVRVLTGHEAIRCERHGDEKVLVAQAGGGEVRLPFDALLCAVGRQARLEGYGLEDLGIPVDRTVETNEYLQTLYPNIYAAGDVAGPYQFTHTASHQAWYATVNALFGGFRRFRADYRVIPAATFIDPEIARVGLNEREARQQGIAYEVTRYGLEELDRAIADGQARGFVKVLTVPGKDRILGATIVGAHAAEMLAEFVLAMRHGLGLGKILGTVHTYPTWSEAGKYAAGEWRRAHQPARLMRWLARYHAWRRG
ncbi:FAD-dependent oxidoreductase [Ramlibacter tataouinensis]|uniref:Candidate mercuric reductase n=1 Tax=Ramlibacter tataouinensis (strain ATCC BAA-407 / DSM 14655 / LMG 21543 / TTB310) TaxID=365046 RepID=F5Y5W5_RAMTT|nr:bifunctional TVP38/TMEM64 family protein/FAD-dependent oxidoreductase [Ramlibacter tataouinensis]AEG91469.1 Candidate mercuric reductase [Ramlibacter tataouinensis TTB310]